MRMKMRINWKVRLRNRAFLAALFALAITFVYDLLALLNIAPSVDESVVTSLCNTVLTLLVGLGVLVDPTTEGLDDSTRVLEGETARQRDRSDA